MDIEGNVEGYELSEIFQLLSTGKKTGTLGVQKGDEIITVYFKEGEIFYAHTSRKQFRLGDLLLKEKKITAEQLKKTVHVQGELKEKKRLGELLVLESLITRQELEDIVRHQVQEVIYELLKWDKGHFRFYESQFPTDEEITIKISTENLILESVRRFDEVARVKNKLPPLDTVLTLVKAESDRRKDISLQPEEWNILRLIDGRRSIQKVIDDSNLDEIEALRRVAGLYLAGLVEPIKRPKDYVDTRQLEKMVEGLSSLLEKYEEIHT